MTSRYIVALKRDQRETAPSDWKSPLRTIDGLEIVGSDDPVRVLVDASDEAIAEVKRVLGDLCHIETMIVHRPLQ